jgi:hypothetical protein
VRNKNDGKIIGRFTYGASMAKLTNRFDQIHSPVPSPYKGTYVASAHASKFFFKAQILNPSTVTTSLNY